MSDLAAIKAERADALRKLVDFLIRRTSDPEMMGVRVLLVDYAMRRRTGFPEYVNNFAECHNLDPTSVCRALKQIDAELEKLLMSVNPQEETVSSSVAS